MPTCEFCDQTIDAGVTQCPFCFAPLDPSAHSAPAQQASDGPTGGEGFFGGDAAAPAPQQPPPAPPDAPPAQHAAPAPQQPPPAPPDVPPAPQHAPPPPMEAPPAPPNAPPAPPDAPPAAPAAAASQEAGVGDMLQSLQKGDVGGVAQGLQSMAANGQLDVGKLASDLGVSGGGQGLDLGSVAQSLTGGGSGASSVLSALGNQGGGLGGLINSAKGALGGTGGMAAGGAALAAGAVGAGLLAKKVGGGGGLTDMLGSLMGGGGGGGISEQVGSMLGGDQSQDSAEGAQLAQIAQQLPEPTVDQLKEGENVLARWNESEWRTAKIGWVDGGQARVTFESGLEKWCELGDMRFPPAGGMTQPSEPPPMSPPQMAPPPPPDAPPPPPPQSASSLPAVGATIQAEVGDNLYAPAQVVQTDEAGNRIYIRYENNYECWHDADKIWKG